MAARWDDVDFDECLKNTRITVLGDIKSWIRDERLRQVYWLNGLAGTGKSTLAKSVAHYAADKGHLGASFFCSRDEKDRSDVKYIFPTLAFQLSKLFPKFRTELIKVVKDRGDYVLPAVQLQKLIIDPLRNTGLLTQPILIVIDALDECKDKSTSSTILMALSKYIDEVPFLKVFVTSRPEPAVRDAFLLLRERSNVLDLHEVRPELVNEDIRRFLAVRLTETTKGRSDKDLSAPWPPERLVKKLAHKAAGSFIFANTVCKFINPDGDLEDQIEQIAELPTDNEGRLGIDDLYRKVFESAIAHFSDKEVSECRFILGTIILLQNPLSLSDLSRLLYLKPGHVTGLLRGFHSVLAIPRKDKDRARVVRIIHTSFHDFLISERRCLDARLLVHPALQHGDIALLLLRRLTDGQQSDLLDTSQLDPDQATETSKNEMKVPIDKSLSYACRFWADHLESASSGNDQLVTTLEKFLRNGLAYWLETLKILGGFKLQVIVTTFQKSKHWYSVCFTYPA